MLEIVDVSAPKGFEVNEVGYAKDEIMDMIAQGYGGIDFALLEGVEENGIVLLMPDGVSNIPFVDPIEVAELVVEKMIELGWRPTREG